jgi:agmatine deiminase
MVLEGGSIDVNGQGTLLTTKSCLLNPNRNPDLSQEDIEKNLREFLGVKKILWLGDGIEGDDTDGHIDDLSRFVGPSSVVTVVEEDENDSNYEPLRANLELLRIYIGNRVVLLPTFSDSNDRWAVAVLEKAFPGRAIVPIDCRELIWGLGAFHCLTQQQPQA